MSSWLNVEQMYVSYQALHHLQYSEALSASRYCDVCLIIRYEDHQLTANCTNRLFYLTNHRALPPPPPQPDHQLHQSCVPHLSSHLERKRSILHPILQDWSRSYEVRKNNTGTEWKWLVDSKPVDTKTWNITHQTQKTPALHKEWFCE